MGTSSDSLPGTVTLPALVACLNCRWLPFWDTCSTRRWSATARHPALSCDTLCFGYLALVCILLEIVILARAVCITEAERWR